MTSASTFETIPDALHGDIDALLTGRHADPFGVLGPHRDGDRTVIRVFAPNAQGVVLLRAGSGAELELRHVRNGFYMADAGDLPVGQPDAYRLRIDWGGAQQETADPYAFGPLLGDLDLYLIGEGRHESLADCLGSHVITTQGVDGVRFAVWAPNARRVSVVGDFNSWDGRRHPMRLRHSAGVWELFIPGLQAGERYKYEIIGAHGNLLPLKADPLARQTEMPPATASVVPEPGDFSWTDDEWMAGRGARQAPEAPMSIYEVHAGSWLPRDGDHEDSVWERLGDRLVPYAKDMGFTHIELMPIMEHPFGGSWGYQPLGVFAPTARYGTPAEFARFIDRCHAAGLGVILDWVPAHFPTDTHGLAQFDGTALYEYSDPREGFHPDWNTLIYNLGRTEVRNFMVASALEWVRRYHVDALRVDAVASMLYRDYSRNAGEWIPNRYGGRENLEAVDFLRDMNATVAKLCPGAITVAEESTAWPGVTARPEDGGLGFTYKWNMGWMHDTLRYMHHEPVHRAYHHHDMTFGMVYAYSERFILPLSHDEVVHGKGSLLNKMPGDRWQQFANLRAYFGFMWTHPGRKLLFMGGEIAQSREWNHDASLDWPALDDGLHRGVQQLVRDLNQLYRELPPLHRHDGDPSGFEWVVGDDAGNSVFAYLRKDGDRHVLAVCNFTPVPRQDYRIGVPRPGWWRERLNTDAGDYGGSGVGNGGGRHTEEIGSHGQAQSLSLTLPPLATVIFEQEG
ncbi:1,4-alpha-glucan branching protein GlgB [Bordetella sputigena]|uniref:1,4-alpha-glucan branching protein GlgB n=1 Tax=Bordetella sputigena TaxID=1416810 RepID=UPI0039EE95D6